jgi:hypothetical protein
VKGEGRFAILCKILAKTHGTQNCGPQTCVPLLFYLSLLLKGANLSRHCGLLLEALCFHLVNENLGNFQ